MRKHQGEGQACDDPGCDVDYYDAFHRADMREDQKDGGYPQSAGAEQRYDHGTYSIPGTAAGP